MEGASELSCSRRFTYISVAFPPKFSLLFIIFSSCSDFLILGTGFQKSGLRSSPLLLDLL